MEIRTRRFAAAHGLDRTVACRLDFVESQSFWLQIVEFTVIIHSSPILVDQERRDEIVPIDFPMTVWDPSTCCASSSVFFQKFESPQFEEIRPKECYRDGSETIFFYQLSGVPSSATATVLKTINELFPLQEKYLKRIHCGNILIKKVEETDSEIEIEKKLKIFRISHPISVVSVPAFPVLTMAQYVLANAIWPIRITSPLLASPICENRMWAEHLEKLFSEDEICSFLDPDSNQVTFGRHKSNLCHAIMDACEQIGKKSPYLATGYTVFVRSEPCLMCSMALLHSRVALVVYMEKSVFGGLGSVASVHVERNLNHKFKVFKLVETMK